MSAPTTAIADVLQLQGRAGWLSPPLRPVSVGGVGVSGPARTVRLAPGPGPDGLKPLHRVLCEDLAGRVVVIAGGAGVPRAVWGELLTRAARGAGAVGAAVDAAVRDAAAVRAAGFPLWASGEATVGPGGALHVAEVGGTVRIGEVDVADGDPVVLDADGAVALPADVAAAVCADAAAYADAEAEVGAALDAGHNLTDAYRHKARLVAALVERYGAAPHGRR